MNKVEKSKWVTDGNHVTMGVPIAKVNKAKRLVSGFATLDNADTENDVVTAEASLDAFSRARGNLREMHKKDSAVGRVVKFKEATYTDDEGNTYKGIYVTARVSEGAETTWKKVLDGTLSGFSIGGNIVDAEETFAKNSQEKVRIIKKYDLTELSLVDNPGNQYANVFSIQKSRDGSVKSISGMVEDQKIVNVFYCNEDSVSDTAAGDYSECPVCLEDMKNIGFVEDSDNTDEKVREVVASYLGRGGEIMTDETTNEDITKVDLEPVDVEETEPEADTEEDIVKRIDELRVAVEGTLEKSRKDTSNAVLSLEKKIEELSESFTRQTNEFDKRFNELDTSLGKARGRLAEFEKSLDSINSSVAFRKSADLDDRTPAGREQKTSSWGSTFSFNEL